MAPLSRDLAQMTAAISHFTASLNGATRHIGEVSAAVRRVHNGVVGAHSGGGGFVAPVVGALGGFVAPVVGALGAHAAVKASAERLHEGVRMGASGMSLAEIGEARHEAAGLAAKFPQIDQTQFLHMLRNARSIVGSYKEAAEIMEPLAKLRIIAQGARPGEDVSEDFDQLVKGLEIKGVTQNPKQFREYMEGIAKGLNVFGDTLKPYQYYEMFKYGRQATPMLSEKFMLGTAPSLAQELGGSSYGKAVSAFNAAIVNNVMKHQAIRDFVKLGLVSEKDVKLSKAGQYSFNPGAHVQGWQLAQSDPNEWVKQYLIPALSKAGVTDRGEVIQRIGAMFQNQQASQLVGILATQQSRIDKDLALLAGAKGTKAADDYMRGDPHAALQGMENSLKSLMGVLGENALQGLTPAMASAATAIAGYTQRLEALKEKEKEHPDATAPAGQPVANRWLNRIYDDVFSDGSHPASDGSRAEAARIRVAEENRAHSFGGLDSDFSAEHDDPALRSYRHALRMGRRPRDFAPPSIAGSGAFSPDRGYANYDPLTGMPNPPAAPPPIIQPPPRASMDRLNDAMNPPDRHAAVPSLPTFASAPGGLPSLDSLMSHLNGLKATVEGPVPVNVTGSAELTNKISIEVSASPQLLATVKSAEAAKTQVPLRSNSGASTPDAGGRKP